jgi:hypothetical protein
LLVNATVAPSRSLSQDRRHHWHKPVVHRGKGHGAAAINLRVANIGDAAT